MKTETTNERSITYYGNREGVQMVELANGDVAMTVPKAAAGSADIVLALQEALAKYDAEHPEVQDPPPARRGFNV